MKGMTILLWHLFYVLFSDPFRLICSWYFWPFSADQHLAAGKTDADQGCQTPFEKKAKPCLKKPSRVKESQMLNNMKFKILY